MKSTLSFISLFGICLCCWGCQSKALTKCDSPKFEKLRGLSVVARPDSFKYNPMLDIQKVNADWIAVIPYGFTKNGIPEVFYNADWQWWGERPTGIRTTTRLAKKAGINTMLKPQIWLHGGNWIGELGYEKEADWQRWEASYEVFIMQLLDIAIEEEIEMFCIGTELEIHVVKRPEFWRQLIKKMRAKYKGKLTYAANWDNFEKTTFWGDLDYIGVNAYFPLDNAVTPKVENLKKAWKKPLAKIEKLYCKYQKPILFTEFGYMSVDGCAYNTWEREAQEHSIEINNQAQVNALDALFETFWTKDWWAGGFLWKWYPNKKSYNHDYSKGYTPQGKDAEECVTKWYGR
jgi:hypothetical protein